MTTVNLKTQNAFGMISVDKKTITVILSAIRADNSKPINRTIKAESSHNLPIGSALIAVNIMPTTHEVIAQELAETAIADHPDVKHVLDQALKWLMESA
jgi:hypothetical protein